MYVRRLIRQFAKHIRGISQIPTSKISVAMASTCQGGYSAGTTSHQTLKGSEGDQQKCGHFRDTHEAARAKADRDIVAHFKPPIGHLVIMRYCLFVQARCGAPHCCCTKQIYYTIIVTECQCHSFRSILIKIFHIVLSLTSLEIYYLRLICRYLLIS